MNSNSTRVVIVTTVFLAMLFGCAGGPKPGDMEAPPDWVFSPPGEEGGYTFFIGNGKSTTGDTAEARNAATASVIDEILRFIGVKVTAESTAKAKASLDSFSTEITREIQQEGSAKIAGFSVQDIWADERNKPEIVLHLLARYETVALLKEKRYMEELFMEAVEAISGPEREGQRLSQQGNYYEAAIQFIKAAEAALSTELEQADIKFKRNIDQAMQAIEGINLIKLNDNLTGQSGEPFPDPVLLKIVTGASESDPGVPDAVVSFTYQSLHEPTSKLRYKSTQAKSDQDGIVRFDHPIPQFVGSSRVVAALDLNAYLNVLEKAPKELRQHVRGLEELIADKRATVRLEVVSGAMKISMGILVLDFDAEGNLVGTTHTSTALRSVLTGYNVLGLSVSLEELRDKDEMAIISLLKGKYQDKIERLLLGRVQIMSFREDSGKIIVKAEGSVQVIDLDSGDVLLTEQKEKSSLGSNRQAAANTAYKDLGDLIGKGVKNKLR